MIKKYTAKFNYIGFILYLYQNPFYFIRVMKFTKFGQKLAVSYCFFNTENPAKKSAMSSYLDC